MNHEIPSIKKQEAIFNIEIGKYNKALDCFYEALSEQPNDGETLFYISYCFFQLDKHVEGIDFCKQALENGYDEDVCNDLLGKFYMEINCFIEAEKCFLEALRTNSDRAGTLAAYSCLMLKAGYPKKAKPLLYEALRMEPESEEVLHYSYLYFLVKNKKTALNFTLQKYFEIANNDINKLLKAGAARYYAGDYKSAKEAIKQAFLLDPTNKDIYDLLKAVEWNGSIVLLPERIIDRIGGPKILWLFVIISLLILKFLEAYKIFFAVAIIYILLAIYTWGVAIALKINKRKKKE